jgi:hypothetical protein
LEASAKGRLRVAIFSFGIAAPSDEVLALVRNEAAIAACLEAAASLKHIGDASSWPHANAEAIGARAASRNEQLPAPIRFLCLTSVATIIEATDTQSASFGAFRAFGKMMAADAELIFVAAYSSRRFFSEIVESELAAECQQYKRDHEHGLSYEHGRSIRNSRGVNRDPPNRNSYGLQTEWTMDEAQRTGHIFPGRPRLRPAIKFSNARGKHTADWQACYKRYTSADSFSAGLMVAICGYSHPCLLGASVMTMKESIAMEISLPLMFFPTVDRLLCDNNCGAFGSVSTRLPWLLRRTEFLVDKFHYGKGHSCGPMFDPRGSESSRRINGSSAESLNAQLAVSRKTIRYLGPDTLIPTVAFRALYLNLGTKWRLESMRSDLEDADLRPLGSQLMPCNCIRCEGARK